MKGGIAVRIAALLAALFILTGAASAQTFTRVARFKPGDSLTQVSESLEPEFYTAQGGYMPPGEYWVIKVVTAANQEYCIVVGPDPNLSSNARGHFRIRTSAYTGIQELSVFEGVAYFAGIQPYGGTQGGSGYSDGTIFMVLGQGSGADDVFIFLEALDEQQQLHDLDILDYFGATTSKSIDARNHYLQVRDDGNLGSSSQRSLFANLGLSVPIRKAKMAMVDIVDEAATKLHAIDSTMCPALRIPCR